MNDNEGNLNDFGASNQDHEVSAPVEGYTVLSKTFDDPENQDQPRDLFPQSVLDEQVKQLKKAGVFDDELYAYEEEKYNQFSPLEQKLLVFFQTCKSNCFSLAELIIIFSKYNNDLDRPVLVAPIRSIILAVSRFFYHGVISQFVLPLGNFPGEKLYRWNAQIEFPTVGLLFQNEFTPLKKLSRKEILEKVLLDRKITTHPSDPDFKLKITDFGDYSPENAWLPTTGVYFTRGNAIVKSTTQVLEENKVLVLSIEGGQETSLRSTLELKITRDKGDAEINLPWFQKIRQVMANLFSGDASMSSFGSSLEQIKKFGKILVPGSKIEFKNPVDEEFIDFYLKASWLSEEEIAVAKSDNLYHCLFGNRKEPKPETEEQAA